MWHGGDHPGGGHNGDGDGRNDWCKLLDCLFRHGVLSDDLIKRLQGLGIDIEKLRACLCRDSRAPAITAAERAQVLAQLGEIARKLG